MPRYISAILFFSAINTWALNLFLAVDSRVTNNTPYAVDLFVQVTNPSSNCYGEACIWSAWPKVNILPGETLDVPLWIGRINQSKLLLSVMRSNDTSFQDTPQYTNERYKYATPYLGDFSITYDLYSNTINKGPQSGAVSYELTYSSGYQLEITIG